MMKRSIRLAVAAAVAIPGLAWAQPQGGNWAVSGAPDLTVASVKAQSGIPASKIIGAAVYNGGNQQVGTVDYLILDD